ncbi:hypothetical protein B0H63DRAFT_510121 [Podospora didyma]|uniref:Nephrocystin 3-like N-terminal domain-containing protein n=1 Tax=Podospora didyma TaxID=330526 RepID=A0AAE0TZK2_9PEZI|nr:hypothetical protein B0H63DRAFT_510121 [Podospora didyma]
MDSVMHAPEEPAGVVAGMSHNIDLGTRQSLVNQLYFDKIDERLTNLKPAQSQTCSWFFDKPEYASWHDASRQEEHGGFLWIKGNPGTGKSTLMKFLFENAKSNPRGGPEQITLSFFFLARGTIEERSTKGLYRSLLHQLFSKCEDLIDSLEWLTADGAKLVERNGWDEEALKRTFLDAVQRLGSRPLMIFVDALDECNKEEAADMVYFFENLCDEAKAAHVRLQTCFSVRHYPTITIETGIELTLEHEPGHTRDIQRYMNSRLRRLGKASQTETLRSQILAKSANIFLWVVLVVDILIREYPNNSVSIRKMLERLKSISPGLKDLFDMILTRDNDHLTQLELCLKWILFATRPLKPEELYFAVQFGYDSTCTGVWDHDDVTLDAMKTFARSASKGLAEVTRNKAAEVQFIHESVLSSQTNEPSPKESATVDSREAVISMSPFLEYSIHHILSHANAAQGGEKNLDHLIRIYPEQRRFFTLTKGEDRYGMPIFAALAMGSDKALKAFADITLAHLEAHTAESMLGAVLENFPAHLMIGRMFSFPRSKPLSQVVAEQDEEALFALLIAAGELSWLDNYLPSGDVLCLAAQRGFEVVVQHAVDMGADLESTFRGQTALQLALERGHDSVTKYLLEHGAKTEPDTPRMPSPLQIAIKSRNDRNVRILLDRGATIDPFCPPILIKEYFVKAVRQGDESMVLAMLDRGADINIRDPFSGVTARKRRQYRTGAQHH